MKKIFSYLCMACMAFFLLAVTSNTAFSRDVPPDPDDSGEVDEDPREINIRDVIDPGSHKPGRSLLPTVEGVLHVSARQVELSFNANVGMVTVTVLNMLGQPVAGYTCNSELEPVIYLPVPVTKGQYTIQIVGPDYEGAGSYIL